MNPSSQKSPFTLKEPHTVRSTLQYYPTIQNWPQSDSISLRHSLLSRLVITVHTSVLLEFTCRPKLRCHKAVCVQLPRISLIKKRAIYRRLTILSRKIRPSRAPWPIYKLIYYEISTIHMFSTSWSNQRVCSTQLCDRRLRVLIRLHFIPSESVETPRSSLCSFGVWC